MNVTVTRSEIRRQHELINILEQWENLLKIGGEYNKGAIFLRCCEKPCLEVNLDSYDRRQETPEVKLEREVRRIMTEAVLDGVNRVIAAINRAMPIAVE